MSGDPTTTGPSYPQDYDVPSLGDRRLLFTARIMTIGLVSSLLANVAMAIALATLMPLKEVRPFLVHAIAEDSIVATIRPITSEYDGLDLLLQSLAKQYVVLRHSVVASPAEMERRWGSENSEMRLMNTRDEYIRFLRQTTPQYAELSKSGTTREVIVNAVTANVRGKSYVVDFEIISRNPANEVIERSAWLANMEVSLEPKTVTFESRLVNPTGFTVKSYTVSQKAKSTGEGSP